MINYLLLASVLLLITYLVYQLFLFRETFYKLNRYTLLLMILLSVSLPFLEVPEAWSFRNDSNKFIEKITPPGSLEKDKNPDSISAFPSEKLTTPQKTARNTSRVTLLNMAYWIYYAGVLIFSITFLIQIVQLKRRFRRLDYIQDGRLRIYEMTDNHPPFSFFNKIFINPALYDYETFEQILNHEKIHIKNNHFFDKIVAECLVVLFWFNPFSWLLRNSISNNLEFQTDDEILETGTDPEKYQLSLLKVSVNRHPLSFTTNYNQTILEKRIHKMKAKKSSMRSGWKYLMIIPVFSLALLSFNPTNCYCDEALKAAETNARNYDHTEEITMEATFSADSPNNTFILANVTGKVTLLAHDSEGIDIHIVKKIHAPSQEQLDKGVAEIEVGSFKAEERFAVYLESPYSHFDPDDNTFQFSENCKGQPCYEYNFQLDYTVKLPKNASVIVQNVNGGDVVVKGVQASHLKVKHITGAIHLENVSGDADVETISGNILASFTKTPVGASSFRTISGSIETTYPNDFSGRVYHKAGDGDFSTDFEINSLYLKNDKVKSPFKVGSGTGTFRFETISGDILLKSNN